ncbi:MAG: hypothetical protein FD129_2524, partial [bacterium]
RHELTVMTRNVGYYAPFSIEVLNPWGDPKDSDYDYGEKPENDAIEPGTTSAEFLIPGGDAGTLEEETAAAA